MSEKLTLAVFGLTCALMAATAVGGELRATTRTAVNLRPSADTKGARIALLPGGTNLVLLEESDGWYRVRTETGRLGWVDGEYLRLRSLRRSRISTNTTKDSTLRPKREPERVTEQPSYVVASRRTQLLPYRGARMIYRQEKLTEA